MLRKSGGSRHITMPNFLKTGPSIAEIMQFFEFSRWPPPPSLIFKITSFLASGFQRIETHEHVKFRQNQSIDCEDVKIFRFLKMAAMAILDCRICKILLADDVWRARRITVPDFVKIGHSFVEILRFFKFSKWPLPPSWIFEITKFYWLTGSRG